nr:hypothetical protein [Tanacetum cinerariifolium]
MLLNSLECRHPWIFLDSLRKSSGSSLGELFLVTRGDKFSLKFTYETVKGKDYAQNVKNQSKTGQYRTQDWKKKGDSLSWGEMVEVKGSRVVMEMGEKMVEKGVGKHGGKRVHG